jgi:hypothetical protein
VVDSPLVFVPRHFVGLFEEWTSERTQLFETMWRQQMMETLAPSFCRVSRNRAILEDFLRPAPGESRKVHCALWATPPAERQFHAKLFLSAWSTASIRSKCVCQNYQQRHVEPARITVQQRLPLVDATVVSAIEFCARTEEQKQHL